jgi:biopolymer transport protein TolR
MAIAPIGDGDDGYRPIGEINVTPLVDVMLVLLIVFMVAAPLMMVGVPIQLPKTAAAKVTQTRQPIIVSIAKDGRVFVRDEEVPTDTLLQRLKELKAADPDATVYVRGDRSVNYGRAVEIMGAVNQAGFAKLSLIAEGASPATPVRAR